MAEILLHNGLDIASKSLSRIEVQTRPISVHRKPAENEPLRSRGNEKLRKQEPKSGWFRFYNG